AALRFVMPRGIRAREGYKFRLASIGNRGYAAAHAARPHRPVEAEQFQAALFAQLRFLIELREVLGRHRDQNDPCERAVRTVQAATRQDGRETGCSGDDGLADVERQGVPLPVE